MTLNIVEAATHGGPGHPNMCPWKAISSRETVLESVYWLSGVGGIKASTCIMTRVEVCVTLTQKPHDRKHKCSGSFPNLRRLGLNCKPKCYFHCEKRDILLFADTCVVQEAHVAIHWQTFETLEIKFVVKNPCKLSWAQLSIWHKTQIRFLNPKSASLCPCIY